MHFWVAQHSTSTHGATVLRAGIRKPREKYGMEVMCSSALLNDFYFMCALYVCVTAYHVHAVSTDSLKLGFQTFVNQCIGAGN